MRSTRWKTRTRRNHASSPAARGRPSSARSIGAKCGSKTLAVKVPATVIRMRADEHHADEDLSEHDLTGVTLVHCTFSRCSLRAAKLVEATVRGCTFIECDFR